MVAETESSDSLPGCSNDATEQPPDGFLDKKSLEKAPKKTNKAEREKLKRDQLNDLFLDLTSMLDLDGQNTGKATVLGDAARVLRDLVTQAESLRKEQSALLTERQYVSSEKNELQEENTTLKGQILELQNEIRARMGNNSLNFSSLGISHPMGTNSSTQATYSMPHHIWSNGSNLSAFPMTHSRNPSSPLQNQHHHSDDSARVYASRPQELQLFPGASEPPERSTHICQPATSSSLADSLPGQLRLSLPQTCQEESSSGTLCRRKERKNS